MMKYILLHNSAPDGVRLNMLVTEDNGTRLAIFSAFHNSKNRTYTLYPQRRLMASNINLFKQTISEQLVIFGGNSDG